ncbi:MAG TPA: hypothetical protein VNB88_10860 [Gaiellaceae bacterium]|nr:hypothetical protein [Gaiellaceae bacterium]
MDHVQRRAYLVAFVVVIGLAVTNIALASPPVIDQYYEEIPTANGGVGGGGGSGSGGGGLPAPMLNQLEGSVSPAVASELQEVATSSRLGAPSAMFKKPAQGAGESGSGSTEAADPLSSAVTAATDGGEAHLTILLILIGLITAGSIGAAARRRRQAPA